MTAGAVEEKRLGRRGLDGYRDPLGCRATTGRAGMVGLQGVAKTELAPGGTVLVSGELWKARAEESIEPGEEVTVESVKGLTLRVRKGA